MDINGGLVEQHCATQSDFRVRSFFHSSSAMKSMLTGRQPRLQTRGCLFRMAPAKPKPAKAGSTKAFPEMQSGRITAWILRCSFQWTFIAVSAGKKIEKHLTTGWKNEGSDASATGQLSVQLEVIWASPCGCCWASDGGWWSNSFQQFPCISRCWKLVYLTRVYWINLGWIVEWMDEFWLMLALHDQLCWCRISKIGHVWDFDYPTT